MPKIIEETNGTAEEKIDLGLELDITEKQPEPEKKTRKRDQKRDKAIIKSEETRTLNINIENGDDVQMEVVFCWYKDENTPVLNEEEKDDNSILVPCLTTSGIRRMFNFGDNDVSKTLSFVYVTQVGGKRYVFPLKMISEILEEYKYKNHLKKADTDLKARYKEIFEFLNTLKDKSVSELKDLTTRERPQRKKKNSSPKEEHSEPVKKSKVEQAPETDVELFILYSSRVKKLLDKEHQKHLNEIVSLLF